MRRTSHWYRLKLIEAATLLDQTPVCEMTQEFMAAVGPKATTYMERINHHHFRVTQLLKEIAPDVVPQKS